MNRSQFEMSVREVNSFVSPLGLEAISYEYTDWQRPNDSDVMVRAVDKMVGDYQVHCESMEEKSNMQQECQEVVPLFYVLRFVFEKSWHLRAG